MQNDLKISTKQFALQIIRLFAALPRSEECRVLGRQVLRSGTSVGANYREAGASRSRDEFIAKLGDRHKELEETQYWLELLLGGGFAPAAKLNPILNETRELTAIVVSSINTAKRRRDE